VKTDPVTLFDFQETAATALRDAALGWIGQVEASGSPRLGTKPIPFVGQLKAVTGAGKTPILADVVAGIGDAVVIWTSKSSAVVEQTYANLHGKYRGLLPSRVSILRNKPGQREWQDLVGSKTGLTIWVLTTASWNEQEASSTGGAVDARLNLHRLQSDWAGVHGSPWEQLKSIQRPLWIVSDESHNQTDTQLDQLHALLPVGFFMASATPVHGELFDEWQRILDREPDWRDYAAAGRVAVRTRDVVVAELLKTTIDVVDFQSGTEESLDGALQAFRSAEQAADAEGALVAPRAIYVVERSNPPRGSTEEARPSIIWRYLVDHGVSPDEIAVFTDTKELPPGAERVTSLSALRPRHCHIIFNQSLQEGWDDPQAYVCYFDGVTKSFTRITQIVGRVLRQPFAQRYFNEMLNTATLIINTPASAFDQVIAELRLELRLYAPDDEPSRPMIRVKTRKHPLPQQALRPEFVELLRLPRVTLSAPDMSKQEVRLRTEGERLWPESALAHPGLGRMATVSLEAEQVGEVKAVNVLKSARTMNGVYFRRRLLARNKNALNSIDSSTYMKGPSYLQVSCQSSEAQIVLKGSADEVANSYEDRVGFVRDPDPDAAEWVCGPHSPRDETWITFANAGHEAYSAANFNKDELEFARALTSLNHGVWIRNADSGGAGYSIPLPFKVGDSLRFFPDFLWWPSTEADGVVPWAIDTTGRHLLNDKVRGKLFSLGVPRIALVVRGDVDLEREQNLRSDRWSAVIDRPGVAKPRLEVSHSLEDLLRLMAE